MKPFRHGLVIGKFYPPHLGHVHLIEQAAAQCERVTVVAMASGVESIAVETRVAWLDRCVEDLPEVRIAGIRDDVAIDYEDPLIWEQHVAIMKEAIAALVSRDGLPAGDLIINAVFTSEEYGDELARRFDAKAVCVDLDRATHPVSGTAVRANIAGNWDFLPDPVKEGLAARVVIVGAESTGTTTVAQAVTERLRERGGVWERTQCVPEYGREYTVAKLDAARRLARRTGEQVPRMEDLAWTPVEFEVIAARQLELENEAARAGSPIVIGDTDAFATGVWYTRYMGSRSELIEAIGDAAVPDLYLLTSHEGVPFEQDGIRDGEHLREWMTSEFVDRLTETGRHWFMLDGTLKERIEYALSAVDQVVADVSRFAEPLG